MICLNIQGASSIEHTIYGHVLGHKGGARAPSAPWLDPPLHVSFKPVTFSGVLRGTQGGHVGRCVNL